MIKVIYKNDKPDEVSPFLLDELIASNQLKMFLRLEGWVTIGSDTIRGMGGVNDCQERRKTETDQVKQIKDEIAAFLKYLSNITEEPLSVFSKNVDEKLNRINNMSLSIPEHRPDLMKYVFEKYTDSGIMNYHHRRKPMGYPGDYLIIDRIYTRMTESEGVGRLWDDVYHSQPAPQAVRNRKTYFCNTFDKLCNENKNGISVLNLACGPCRDVKEAIALSKSKGEGCHFHCVDMDKRAVDYATTIVNGQSMKASFTWEVANVLKFRSSHLYDFVWSAGLSDYLEDRYASFLLKKMWGMTKEGGKFIFGNFHPRNPSRNYMEWCGEWFLIHRTEEQLMKLCKDAGISESCISFDQEPLGINIFCTATKK